MRLARRLLAMLFAVCVATLLFATAASADDAGGDVTVSTQAFDEPAVSTQASDEPTSSGSSSSGSSSQSSSPSASPAPEPSADPSDAAPGAGTTQSPVSTQPPVRPAASNQPTGVYADLTLEGGPVVDTVNDGPQTLAPPPGYTGSVTFPGIVNAPDATFEITPVGVTPVGPVPTVDPSLLELVALEPDTEAWIPGDTSFGQVFGPSGPSTTTEHLRIGNAFLVPGGVNGSVNGVLNGTLTTISFSSPMLAGAWGFAIVGIDLETAVIGGLDASGAALSGRQLNGSAFDVCTSSSAPPAICFRVAGGPDVSAANGGGPAWDPATSTCSPSPFLPGAGCWFRPTTNVSTITLLVTTPPPSFAGSYLLWIAALKADLTVELGFPAGGARVPVQIDLFGPDGAFLGSQTATDAAVFANLLAASGYVIRVVPPQGFTAVGGTQQTVDLGAGNVVALFELVAPAPVHPAASHPEAGDVTLASFGTLPRTGVEPGLPVFLAVVLVAFGVVLLGVSRRRFV